MKLPSIFAWLLAGALCTPPALAAGASSKAMAPRTSFGKPDLTGTWTNASLTALERDTKYGERLVLSPQEVQQIEAEEAAGRAAGDAPTDPKLTIEDLPKDCGRGFTGTNCGYNSGWVDPGWHVMRVDGQPRSSFITSTKNGRVPAMKPEAAQQMQARFRRPAGMGPIDNPEQRALGERCLLSFGNSAGPVMLPLLYNNNYQFILTKDELAIVVEMVHDVRHIRLNAKEHLPRHVRPWMGDSIGWWEGDTLVAETTNFHPAQNFRGASENLKVTERFTRKGPDRIHYAFKVEDPTVWNEPWGGEYEFSAQDKPVYEYACHEGNYALEGILAGARAEEAAAAAKAASAAPGGAAR